MNFEEESKAEQIQELIDTALTNKHNEVEQINNLNEYFAAKSLSKGLYKLFKSFAKSANIAYNDYIYNLKNRIDDVQSLFDYRTLKHCEKYYYDEYANTWSAIEEYRSYLSCGNFFKSLFGHDRRDDDYDE